MSWPMFRGSCTYGPKRQRHACSRWHAELVASYRAERARQEQRLEATVTYGYQGDRELWQAQGGHLVTFQDWLLAHRDVS